MPTPTALQIGLLVGLLGLFGSAAPAPAQFLGGTGDGYARSPVATTPINSAFFFLGGSGDGYVAARLDVAPLDGVLFFLGSGNDGYARSALSLTPISQVRFYTGGPGDGYTAALLGLTPLSLVLFYQGSNGDGYAHSTLSLIPISQRLFYAGGPGDGYARHQPGPAPIGLLFFYQGGSGDGYARALHNPTLLPVELTAFAALVEGQAVVLRWETASELNNAGFDVETQPVGRSTPQSQEPWLQLGFVEGRGTTEVPQGYQYRAEGLEPGPHRFRLKQIDYDGTFEYSPVVEAVLDLPEAFFVSAVYPNPFNPQARFTLRVQRPQQVRIALFTVEGRLVKMLFDGEIPRGETRSFSLDAGSLASGSYLLRITGGYFATTRRVMLLK